MGYVSAIRNNAIAVLGLTVWLIAGCAATDYQSSISKFADAAKKSDDSVKTMFATRREARVAMQVKEVGEGKLNVRPEVDECTVTGVRCRLVSVPSGRDEPRTPLLANEGLENLLALSHGVSTYAAKLADIVDAPTAKNALASMNEAKGSIESIVDSTNKFRDKNNRINPDTTKATADPAVSIISWFVGAYVEHVKVESLRSATAHAEQYIPRIAKVQEDLAKLPGPAIETANKDFGRRRGEFARLVA